jgi:hypothetical protein
MLQHSGMANTKINTGIDLKGRGSDLKRSLMDWGKPRNQWVVIAGVAIRHLSGNTVWFLEGKPLVLYHKVVQGIKWTADSWGVEGSEETNTRTQTVKVFILKFALLRIFIGGRPGTRSNADFFPWGIEFEPRPTTTCHSRHVISGIVPPI